MRGPQPGEIVPDFLQDALKLTAEQKKALAALQKQADEKLQEILTEEQRKQFKEMREHNGPRPGGPFGPGGPDGD